MTCSAIRSAGIALCLVTIPLSSLVAASDIPPPSVADAATSADSVMASSEATGVFGGEEIKYLATLEKTSVHADTEGKGASIVSISYSALGVEAPNERPVLFVFNGGPISASYPLHIGATGTHRVAFDDDITVPADQAELAPNPYSPLNVADIVYYDPAQTGLSTLHEGVEESPYASVREDAALFVEFVHNWLEAHDRADAPVFMLGESYGTMRAAEAAGQFVETYPEINLDGVFLMGQAVNMIEYAQRRQNILSYVVSVPTLAAAAWDLELVEKEGYSFNSFLEEATAFADTEYLTALYEGQSLSEKRLIEISETLETYTGLSAEIYAENNLRVSKEVYRRRILEDKNLLIGRSDMRYTAPMSEAGGRADPSHVIGDRYASAFATHFENLFDMPLPDDYASLKILPGWDYNYASPFADFNYGRGISKAFEAKPDFRLVIGTGWHDSMTTAGGARYAVSQSDWPADRVKLAFYRGGHMAYSIEKSAEAFGEDIRTMIKGWDDGEED